MSPTDPGRRAGDLVFAAVLAAALYAAICGVLGFASATPPAAVHHASVAGAP